MNLPTVTYKPNVRLTARLDTQLLVLEGNMDVPNADPLDPTSIVTVQFANAFALAPLVVRQLFKSDELNREAFEKLVYDFVTAMEEHEIQEWLRIDGVRVREPHPGARIF